MPMICTGIKKASKFISSGGSGRVNIFKQTGDTSYKQIANIETRNGARTSLLVPELGVFLIAARANGEKNATLLVYKISR